MKAGNQRGFSLLEMLVAFSIMAIALVGIYQIMGNTVRAGLAYQEHTRALLLAESLLQQYSIIPASGVENQGRGMGSLDWNVEARLHEGEVVGAWPLYSVEVQVRWGEANRPGSGSVRLYTLAPQEPEQGS